jgi:hypothetical protein
MAACTRIASNPATGSPSALLPFAPLFIPNQLTTAPVMPCQCDCGGFAPMHPRCVGVARKSRAGETTPAERKPAVHQRASLAVRHR